MNSTELMKPLRLVMLVDDDETFSSLEKRVMKRTELVEQTISFCNGREAINYIQTNIDHSELLPEIIFLDLNMPEMNGYTFLEEFNKIKTQLPHKIYIFVVSSSASEHDRSRIELVPEVTDYIVKPITPEKIEEIALIIRNEGRKEEE